jgi:hypothetical protein
MLWSAHADGSRVERVKVSKTLVRVSPRSLFEGQKIARLEKIDAVQGVAPAPFIAMRFPR